MTKAGSGFGGRSAKTRKKLTLGKTTVKDLNGGPNVEKARGGGVGAAAGTKGCSYTCACPLGVTTSR